MDAERLAAHTFLQAHPEDAARVLEQLSQEEITSFLEDTPAGLAAGVVKQMNMLTAAGCLARMNPARAGLLVEHLAVELAAVLLRRVADAARTAILEKTPREARDALERVLAYPEDTAGAVMDPAVLTLLEDVTVKEVLKDLRAHARHLTRYLYVVDREHRLVGVLTFRELFTARPGARVGSIMHTDVQRLFAYSDRASVLAHPGWLDHYALPVVEEGDLLVGLLRYRTLRRLEVEGREKRPAYQVEAAGSALGELYQIGLSGLVRGAISLTGPTADQ